MADLRLVGVHEGGSHLLLSGPDGDNYLLPLDEALRTAVGKGPHQYPRKPAQANVRMTPREIQAMVRSGSTAAQVADVSGHTIEQIRRYEGPVLAEREYIASQARKVEVAAAATHSDGYRSTFGDNPASLDDMVRHRLGAFGIDPKSLRWDAWRDESGNWSVSADFDPGTEWAANSIGEPAPALWRFHPVRKSLHNANRWAQQLSELEPVDSPVPERRLSAVVDKPFDIDADAPEEAETETPAPAKQEAASANEPSPEETHAHGLLDMLRSRRGVRLGLDEDGDDELATMLGNHVPETHVHGEDKPTDPASEPETPERQEAPASEADASTSPDSGSGSGSDTKSDSGAKHGKNRMRNVPFLKLAPRLHEPEDHSEASVGSVAEVSTETREVVLSGEPSTPAPSAPKPHLHAAYAAVGDGTSHETPAADSDEDGPSDSEVAARLERKAAGKPKRSSVPSWDEIVFGTKGD